MEGGPGAVRSQFARRNAARVLVVLGAVTLFFGVFLLYARENLFDSETFAVHATEVLDDERADSAIANPIVDAVIESGPEELINARPLLAAAVGGVLKSDPFRDAFRDAATRVHRQLFNRDRDELILNVADTGGFVIEAVKSISPEVGKQIPDDVRPALVEVTQSNFAIGAVEAAEGIRFFGLAFPFIGVAMLIGSIALAPDRRRGVMDASVAVAVVCAAGFIVLLIGRAVLLGHLEDDIRDGAAAAWDAFLGELYGWFLLGGIAAIVLASASATMGEVNPMAPLQRWWDRFTRTPSSNGWRAARAVALLLVSVFVVVDPDVALNIAAVLIGAFGLYIAVGEILFVVAPLPPDAPEPVPLRRRVRPSRAIGIGVAGAIAIVLAIALIGRDGDAKRPAGPVEACNGYAKLCDRPLNQVAFPGAHNAMSAADADFFAPNQERGLPKQLDAGVRVLLIDAHYGIKPPDGPVITDLKRERGSKARQGIKQQFGKDAVERVEAIGERTGTAGGEGERGTFLCHVVCELGATELTEALTGVREFVDTHPDEFLIIVIEDYVAPQDVERSFKDSGLLRYAYVHERDAPFPTLRELIESDQRVLVMAENDNGGGAIPWYHDGFDLMQETPFTFDSANELEEQASCKQNRGSAGNPLFQLNHWVEKVPRSPDLGAEVNEYRFLLARARECRKRRGLIPNLVAVDFWNEGDVFEVSRKLNRLPREKEPTVRETG